MSRFHTPTKLRVAEALEHRILLAADLVVEVDTFEMESPGEEVTRTIRVSNNGDSDAVDAVIHGMFSQQFEDPSWSRENGLAEFLHREDPKQVLLQTMRTEENFGDSRILGDVNNDGQLDYWVEIRDDDWNRSHYIVFGSGEEIEIDAIPTTSTEEPSPTGVFFIAPGDRLLFPHTVGDINGDNIEDFVVKNNVIFGSTTLGSSGAIELANLSAEAGFEITKARSTPTPWGIGDVNDDGFDELVVSDTIVLGSADVGQAGSISLDEGTTDPNVIRTERFVWRPANSGDIDNDGIDDFGIGLEVFKGRENSFLANDHTKTTLRATLKDGWGGESYPINAGDVNGDGIDDLVYAMRGPFTDGTASDKASSYVKTGLNIIFGHPEIFDNETLDVATEGLTIEIATHYFDRPQPRTEDRNDDGVLDIVFETTGKEYVIFGGTELESMTFGYDELGAFDGTNGFATVNAADGWRRDFRRFDDVDYLLEEDREYLPNRRIESLQISRIEPIEAWSPPTEGTANGSGDLQERVTVPAGESLIYTVRGKLKPDASPTILATAVANTSTSDSEIAYGSSGELSAENREAPSIVDLSVSLSHTQLTVGEKADFEIAIENLGPFLAKEVSIASSILTTLDNPSWTITTERLFPDTPEWSSDLGPEVSGFSVVFPEDGNSAWPPSDLTNGGTTHFGSDAAALGDINGDGFDDFRLDRKVYFGSEQFGVIGFDDSPSVVNGLGGSTKQTEPGQLVTHTGQIVELVQKTAEVVAVGDLNRDGHEDYAAKYQAGRNPHIHIVFGQEATFDSPLDLSDHSQVALPDSVWQLSITAQKNDLDADGAADLAIAINGHNGGLYVISGDESLSDDATITPQRLELSGPSDELTFGDFNHDGVTDIVSSEEAGVATVYFGGKDLLAAIPRVASTGHLNEFGISGLELNVLDVNGDEVDDLLVGSPFNPPWGENGTFGHVFVMLGRDATNLAGTVEFDSFDIAPGERIVLRIEGKVTEETLGQQIAIETSNDQFELNPFNNSVRADFHNGVIATDELLAIDIDSSGQVDFADFLALSANFGMENVSQSDGDFNGDNVVDFIDFLLLSQWFGTRTT